MVGHRKIESDDDVPQNHSLLKDDDPYPIVVFGIKKPVPSTKIGKYLNSEFFHYLSIYKNVKNYGLPYKTFLDAPQWLLDLIDKFDAVTEEYNRYALSKRL